MFKIRWSIFIASALIGCATEVTSTEDIDSVGEDLSSARVCGDNDACSSSEYCAIPTSQMCGGLGVCRTRPSACTRDYRPVCGCDGETYGNACSARSSGSSVAYSGECEESTVGENCGGIAGFQCAQGEFCNFENGSCGAGDQFGTCAELPELCTLLLSPVCGCDGKSYSNSCMANIAGVSVDYRGRCMTAL